MLAVNLWIQAGSGIRYRMITEYDINVGLDMAWGNEERVFYFRIGEAF